MHRNILVTTMLMISIQTLASDITDSLLKISTIYKNNQADPLVHNAQYSEFGDSMVNYLFESNAGIEDEKKRVRELYESDRDAGRLSCSRLVFLGLQVAMALTPENRRHHGAGGAVAKYIKSLQNFVTGKAGGHPAWLQDFARLSELKNHQLLGGDWGKFINNIEKCTYHFHPFALLGQKAFTARQYLEAISKGIFIYGIDDTTKNGVHGGIFDTPIAKTVHDLLHLTQQLLSGDHEVVSPEEYISYGMSTENVPVATAWREIAAAVLSILDNENSGLTPNEKSKLEVLSFLMLHETSSRIHEVCSFSSDESLSSKALQIAKAWYEKEIPGFAGADTEEDYYKDLVLNELTRIEQSKGDTFELFEIALGACTSFTGTLFFWAGKGNQYFQFEMTLNGSGNFGYFKSFRRDTAHLLRRANLWQAPEKLGHHYKISEVKLTLEELYQWFCQESSVEGKLQRLFDNGSL